MGTAALPDPTDPATIAPDLATGDRLHVAGDADTLEALVASAEQRSHALWTTEPEVSLERRGELMADLSTIDAGIAAICLAMITASGDQQAERLLLGRARSVSAQLAALENAWSRSAA